MPAIPKKNECIRQFGFVRCANHTVGNLTASGMIQLTNMTVQGICQLQGKIQIKDSVLNKLHAYGQLTTAATTIHGLSRIYGNAAIHQSHYQDSVQIWSQEVTVSGSTFDADMVIHGDGKYPCKLILKDNTKIIGDVVFKECTGRIELRTGSGVYGAIIDGEVINERR